MVERLAVKILKLNHLSYIAAQFDIPGIPAMILFKDGQEIARQSGAMMAGQIEQWIGSQLA
jgi:thioredoxin 2